MADEKLDKRALILVGELSRRITDLLDWEVKAVVDHNEDLEVTDPRYKDLMKQKMLLNLKVHSVISKIQEKKVFSDDKIADICATILVKYVKDLQEENEDE